MLTHFSPTVGSNPGSYRGLTFAILDGVSTLRAVGDPGDRSFHGDGLSLETPKSLALPVAMKRAAEPA